MNVTTVPLPTALHPDLAAEIERQAIYVSSDLHRLIVSREGDSLLLEYDGEEPVIRGRVGRFVEAMCKGFRPLDKRTVWEHRRQATRPYARDVFRQLVARGLVLDLGPGQVALAGLALTLAQRIEQAVATAGRERFGAVERAYPMLIPAEALSRCGYMDSFPQHLSMVVHLHEDFDTIEHFRRSNAGRKAFQQPEPGAVAGGRVCLCPALCYHCYPVLAGATLAARGHVETAIGRIARYESSAMIGLERLWEFTQRSIIWLGGDAFCTDCREQALAVAQDLVRAWDIDCKIETASDPFFASVATAKSFWQRAQDLKLELRAAIEPGEDGTPRSVAAASFNMHGTFFGSAFDIQEAGGGAAFSGCAAWGVERWVLAVFTQHGFDPALWPDALRP